ncbi:MAG: hypothetical protein QM650_16095 [Microlunatus sp.]
MTPPPRWHAALAYALLGPPVRELVEPGVPRVGQLLDDLGGVAAVSAQVLAARAAGPWPYQVPAELRTGLGAAQYAAAWRGLIDALGPLTTNARPVVTDRALTAEERRLSADRPPHHGG